MQIFSIEDFPILHFIIKNILNHSLDLNSEL